MTASHSKLCAAAAVLALGTGLAAGTPGPASAQSEVSDSHAIFFMYHRFGDERFPSTNVRMEQLRDQLDYLEENDYNFASLPEAAEAIAAGESLPERTVVITVDDAYLSFYETGWPEFRERDIPVALFASTEPTEAGRGDYMTWDQIREVQEEGVYIGHHGHAHAHMTRDLTPEEARADLERADEIFERELGEAPRYLAYPYGEYSNALQDIVEEMGFQMAWGQHSGVAHHEGDPLGKPRYAVNEQFGNLDDFTLRANTLPLPVHDVAPADTVVTSANNPPEVAFTIDAAVPQPRTVNCFASGHGQVDVSFTGPDERRAQLQLTETFQPPRARYNCTIAAGGQQFRWAGRQFVIHPDE